MLLVLGTQTELSLDSMRHMLKMMGKKYIYNFGLKIFVYLNLYEPVHEISNNVECAASKASDQPAHMQSLIRAFASLLSIL